MSNSLSSLSTVFNIVGRMCRVFIRMYTIYKLWHTKQMYHEARTHVASTVGNPLLWGKQYFWGEGGIKYLVTIHWLADYHSWSHNRDDFVYLSKVSIICTIRGKKAWKSKNDCQHTEIQLDMQTGFWKKWWVWIFLKSSACIHFHDDERYIFSLRYPDYNMQVTDLVVALP